MPRRRVPLFRLVLSTFVALLLAAGSLPASANGKPIQVILTYLPNVSNTGSREATGVAELVLAEGEARVAATGLPRLDPPERYEAWIVNTTTNEAFALGSFNTAYTTGSARLDQVLPQPIPDKGWNLFMVTIETTASPARPSNRVTIAGTFPPSGTEPQPNLLPNTGGPVAVPAGQTPATARSDWMLVAGLSALSLAGGLGAGYLLGRTRNRRSSRA